MGHSFGGMVQILNYLSNNLKIVIASLILFDPATEFMNQQEGLAQATANQIKCPVLVISSEYFDKQIKEMNYQQNLKKFLDLSSANKENILSIMIKETGHENFSDLGYLMPRELSFKKLTGNYEQIGLNTIIINKIIEFFIENMLFTEKKDKNRIIT